MAKCSFCGEVLEAGTGKMYVKKDGKILHFCKMKCEKNMIKLKRKPLSTAWTKGARKEKKGGKK
jgi:large subunit ribosomal protein L24e